MYRITIRRKDGSILTAKVQTKYELQRYFATARLYGDKVVRVDRQDVTGSYRQIRNLAFLGIGLGVGIAALGAINNLVANQHPGVY